MPDLNQAAPNFTLLDQERKPHSLSDYRGKKVILAFYPAAFSGICTKEMCSFQAAMAQLNDANAVVLGISPDQPFAQDAFAKANGITFPLLFDMHLEAAEAYGIKLENFAFVDGWTANNRALFLVDEEGTLTWSWIPPHPGHEPDYEAVLAQL